MQASVARIEENLKKRLLHNESIYVRELVVLQRNNLNPAQPPHGEFNSMSVTSPIFNAQKAKKETEDELIERIVKHIIDLCEIGTSTHVTNNFINPTYYLSPKALHTVAYAQVKKNHPSTEPSDDEIKKASTEILKSRPTSKINSAKYNHITRLSLQEFSLYPHKERGPLTEEGFERLLTKIAMIVKNYPDNFHLLLATVPILFSIRIKIGVAPFVENIAIYIECGKNPEIHTFSKAHPSTVDATYPNTNNQPFIANPSEKSQLANFVTIKNGDSRKNIQFGGHFYCKTRGGRRFRLTAEICLDNKFKLAKRLAFLHIDSAEKTGMTVEPVLNSQMVTSNVLDGIENYSQVSDMVVQVDPISFYKGSIFIGNQSVMPVSHYEIKNPVFGPQTILSTYQPVELKQHIQPLQKRINPINEFNIRLQAFHIYRDQHPLELAEVSHEINLHIVKRVLDALKKLQCSPVIEKALTDLPSTQKEIINILKKLKLETKNKDVQKIITVAIHLLKAEQRKIIIIKKQLALAKPIKKEATKTPPDTENLQTSGGSYAKVNTLFSLVATGVHSLLGLAETTNPTPILSEHDSDKDHSTTSEPFHEDTPYAANSTFTQPLTSMEKLIVLQYAAYYSPFTFPWNKVVNLTSADIAKLNENLKTLDILDKQFKTKKQKRAYRFGINANQYADVEMMLKNTRNKIQHMLKHHTKTSATFEQVQDHISRIQTQLSQLTNPKLEGALQQEEIQHRSLTRPAI